MNQPFLIQLRTVFLSLLIFAITYSGFSSSSTTITGLINGPISVCEGSTELYSTPYTTGYTYNWSTTSTIGSSAVNLTIPASEFTVTWGSSTTSPEIIHLAVYDGTTLIDSAAISVTIVGTPSPLILSDFNSDCTHLADTTKNPQGSDKPRDDACETVCEGLTVNYTTAFTSGNTYAWQVIGLYQSIANENTNTTSITWGTPGQAYVIVTETTPEGCSWTDTTCINIIETPHIVI